MNLLLVASVQTATVIAALIGILAGLALGTVGTSFINRSRKNLRNGLVYASNEKPTDTKDTKAGDSVLIPVNKHPVKAVSREKFQELVNQAAREEFPELVRG